MVRKDKSHSKIRKSGKVPGFSTPFNEMSHTYSISDFFNKTVKLKVLEFHENSIVTNGISLNGRYDPQYVCFKGRRKERKLWVVDSMITPEITILYFERSPMKYSHSKKYLLYLTRNIWFNGIPPIKYFIKDVSLGFRKK